MGKISKSLRDTEKIAGEFLAKILKKKGKPGAALVIALSGELGAGKTAFTQAAARHLGIKNKISSPTFVIMKKYPVKHPKNLKYKYFFHLDAYRLKNEKELSKLGWEEIVSDDRHLIFIEWPERVAKIIPKNSHFIHIKHTKDGNRNFEV